MTVIYPFTYFLLSPTKNKDHDTEKVRSLSLRLVSIRLTTTRHFDSTDSNSLFLFLVL